MSAKSCSQNATELLTNRIMVLAKSICPSKIFASQTQERQAKEDVFLYLKERHSWHTRYLSREQYDGGWSQLEWLPFGMNLECPNKV